PVAYASRTMTTAEQKYSTTEKEVLAVIYALKQFRNYIGGQKTTIFTDHQAIQTILNWKHPTGRIARWITLLQGEDLEIRYKKGSSDDKTDALSGLPAEEVRVTRTPPGTLASITKEDAKPYNIQDAQKTDTDCVDIVKNLQFYKGQYIMKNNLLH